MKSSFSAGALEGKIRKAFGCVASIDSISEEEARELNHGINRVDNASFKRLLPLLMLREMHSENKCSFQGTGDHLVYVLDGGLEQGKRNADQSGGSASCHMQLEFNQRRFSGFSTSEADAILAWLREVAIPKYGDLCHDAIASAIKFWEGRLRSCETRGVK
jgi:hypothetical protein